MKDLNISLSHDDDEYVLPCTKKNLEILLNADYEHRTLLVLNDEDNNIVAIVSTEITSFYIDGEDDEEDDDTESEIETNKNVKTSSSTTKSAFQGLVDIYKEAEMQFSNKSANQDDNQDVSIVDNEHEKEDSKSAFERLLSSYHRTNL